MLWLGMHKLSLDHNKLLLHHNNLSLDHNKPLLHHNNLSLDHNKLLLHHNNLSLGYDNLENIQWAIQGGCGQNQLVDIGESTASPTPRVTASVSTNYL
ncbi:hypothetical protein [Brasilonema bromeliae]|uniref:Uncharacterized protein n=1 Tax=Brasilonema bromeliae SPC951 TaxID=385972 RepID=A0ABX1P8I4_9CYAN|nr:hypothetical protein [Brasilonema bromeliae]NMG20333.1 hypothetical protein [Brasilonema bromeliae SPC951]